MRTLAFAASNSTKSINRALVGYAAERLLALHPAADVKFLDIDDYEMPIYSPDRQEADGIHPLAQRLFDEIGSADALIVSFAEYNGFVTAAWKNIYDWMSRIDQKVWQDKPFVLLAASPGGRAGVNVLQTQEQTAPFFGMDIKGKFGVGNWADAWDGSTLTREEDRDGIEKAVSGLLT